MAATILFRSVSVAPSSSSTFHSRLLARTGFRQTISRSSEKSGDVIFARFLCSKREDWTSYKREWKDLKEGAFPLLWESQVVIDVHDLTSEEKHQILYSHIKLGKQAKGFQSAIKPYLFFIAAHPRFVPETARRLGDPIFTSRLIIIRYDLNDFVEELRIRMKVATQPQQNYNPDPSVTNPARTVTPLFQIFLNRSHSASLPKIPTKILH